MLKPQDIVVLVKLLAQTDCLNWPQHRLAAHLCLSVSAINASLMRLSKSGLIHLGLNENKYQPVMAADLEVLVCGVKYFFPAEVGALTLGIATSYAAPIFEKKIMLGEDPIPVWPTEEGDQRGIGLKPLYHCIPNSLLRYPDQNFYDLLALVDAVRQGRAREKNIAINLLKEKLLNGKHVK